jgi:iron complex transport system ATP-binding protein
MRNGLSLSDVRVTKGGTTIVSGATFDAPAGRITGIVGPNGAGKSTLIEAIAGINRFEGSMAFDGVALGTLARRTRARLTAYVAQSASTEERLSVRDVVSLGRIPHASVWSPGLSTGDEAIMAGALDRLGLTELADRLFTSLSGGEQQRVHIARALAQQSPLLVLDEPTSHLDIRAQMEMLDVLSSLSEEGGNTVLIALHDLNLALRYCHWLVVMKAGQVVAEGRPEEILTPELLAEVYGVRALLIAREGAPVLVYDGVL